MLFVCILQEKLQQTSCNSAHLDSLEVDLSMLAAQNGLRTHIQHSVNTQELYAQVCAVKTFQTEILTPAVVSVVQFSKNLEGFCDVSQVSVHSIEFNFNLLSNPMVHIKRDSFGGDKGYRSLNRNLSSLRSNYRRTRNKINYLYVMTDKHGRKTGQNGIGLDKTIQDIETDGEVDLF